MGLEVKQIPGGWGVSLLRLQLFLISAWTSEVPRLSCLHEHQAALQRTYSSYNSFLPAMTSKNPGVLSWMSFCRDPCSWGSQAYPSRSQGSPGSVGPAARLTCTVAAKAPLGSCTRGARHAEGCLPPHQNYKDDGFCRQFRAYLAHNCTCRKQTREKTRSRTNLR